jgi:hypothetical protein
METAKCMCGQVHVEAETVTRQQATIDKLLARVTLLETAARRQDDLNRQVLQTIGRLAEIVGGIGS